MVSRGSQSAHLRCASLTLDGVGCCPCTPKEQALHSFVIEQQLCMKLDPGSVRFPRSSQRGEGRGILRGLFQMRFRGFGTSPDDDGVV